MREHKEPPLFSGGQGRTGDEVEKNAVALFWLVKLVGVVVVAAAVYYAISSLL
jgi:hypothetical protein